ncbi:hypothetical protein K438DRAFT_1928004 [Mycena galopus ATCC 62051]|nr:hypothetical protein K438DRAFT_1928004 [Mycena galopus ATCC 62051]
MPLVCHRCGHRTDWDTVQTPKSLPIPAQDAPAASQRAALADVEKEIARFENYSAFYTSVLMNHRDEVQGRLKAIAYPVLSLPPEITSAIFVECLPKGHLGVRPSSTRAPLVLLEVCRRWKEIALSTCALWSSLDILCVETFVDEPLLVPSKLLGIKTWLSRAQARPLSLTIRENYSAHGFQVQDDVLETERLDISTSLSQIRRLEIMLGETACMGLIPSNMPLPLLQSLRAVLQDAELESILQNAPLLADLYWFRISRGIPDLSWSATSMLTKLTIVSADISIPAFISILQSCASLSEFTCYVDPLDFGHHQPSLTFPNLLDLSLFLHEDSLAVIPVIHALEPLTLPNLTRLQFSSPFIPDIISSFLSRSACVIRHLTCEIPPHGALDAWKALGMLPSVESLDITLEVNIAEFLKRIDTERDEHDPSPLILPKLQQLTITYAGDAARTMLIDYRHILGIVDRRELKLLHITMDDPIQWNWYPGEVLAAELRARIGGGLDFRIEPPYGAIWP